MLSSLLAAVMLTFGAAPPPPPPTPLTPGAMQLTLGDAVKRSLASSHALAGAEAAKAGQIAQTKVARGRFGPLLRVEFGVQVWDSDLTVSLGSFGGVEVPAFKVRDATSWNLSVMLVQPLTALWSVYESHELAKLGVNVAELQKRVMTRDRGWRTIEAYVRVKRSEALILVAKNSITLRQAQEKRVRVLEAAGVIRRQDLLRAQLAVSSAKQNLSTAKRQRQLASAQLAILVGVPPSANLALAPLPEPWDKARLNVPKPMASAEASKVALRQRIELVEVRARLGQAHRNVALAKSKMLPELNFITSFQSTGGSDLQGGDQFFVGLNFSWNVFDWGVAWYGIELARAGRMQAKTGLDELREAIDLEVEAARIAMSGARDQCMLAKKTIVVAEENLKLQQTRYEEKAATSFDVIEAETQLTQSVIDAEMASFDYLIASVALQRAMGMAPTDSTDPTIPKTKR